MSVLAQEIIAIGVLLVCIAFAIERFDGVDKRNDWLRECQKNHDVVECKP